jgi:hypothetical protein
MSSTPPKHRAVREADEACAMPGWFWPAAALVFVGVTAASALGLFDRHLF